jgi:hypothetical protein
VNAPSRLREPARGTEVFVDVCVLGGGSAGRFTLAALPARLREDGADLDDGR